MPRLKYETSRRVSVYMDDVDDDDRDEIAGMLRGLACAIDGFSPTSPTQRQRGDRPLIFRS